MIQMIDRILPRNPSRQTAENRSRAEIVRRWVETADERCPLACVWFALPDISADQDDEPESRWPAFSLSRLKAGCLQSINSLAAPSNLAQSLKNSIHIIAAILLVAISGFANAQEQDVFDDRPGRPAKLPEAPRPADETVPTMFPHSETSRYFIAGQANIIFQAHGPFHSPYEGPNSLHGPGRVQDLPARHALSRRRSCGATRRPKPTPSSILNRPAAAGISEALGLAGFTNLDVVRNPNLGSVPYMARVQVHQTIGFTDKMVDSCPDAVLARDPGAGAAARVPRRQDEPARLSRHQQHRHRQPPAVHELDRRQQRRVGLRRRHPRLHLRRCHRVRRQGLVRPLRACADANRRQRHRSRLEPAAAPAARTGSSSCANRCSASCFLRIAKASSAFSSYVNHAHMGLYRDADQGLSLRRRSDSGDHEARDVRRGEVRLRPQRRAGADARICASLAASAGTRASTSPSPTPRSTRPLSLAATTRAEAWSRPYDKLGVAFVSNAIKADHQAYLKLGGLGFLLGDGKLNYAPRRHPRELLQPARLARHLLRARSSIHRPSRLQQGPRPGAGRIGPDARGLLGDLPTHTFCAKSSIEMI